MSLFPKILSLEIREQNLIIASKETDTNTKYIYIKTIGEVLQRQFYHPNTHPSMQDITLSDKQITSIKITDTGSAQFSVHLEILPEVH